MEKKKRESGRTELDVSIFHFLPLRSKVFYEYATPLRVLAPKGEVSMLVVSTGLVVLARSGEPENLLNSLVLHLPR